MFSSITAFLLISLLLGAALCDDLLDLRGKPFKWEYCSTEQSRGYLLQLANITLSPNPPKRGKPLTVSVAGSLTGEVAKGARLTYSVKLGLIQLVKKTVDLCDVLQGAKDPAVPQCPVKPQSFNITREDEMPGELPAGRYKLAIEAVGADNKTIILCVNADMTLPLID